MALEGRQGRSYCQSMKKKKAWLLAGAMVLTQAMWAQGAAVEERLNKMSGHVEDLLAAQKLQQERIAELAKELSNLREQALKSSADYAGQEEMRKLAEKVQEIDQKRVADNERIIKEIEKLSRTAAAARPDGQGGKSPKENKEKSGRSGSGEKGFEYVIQSGDTLSTIALAYREKGVKISSEQILRANPGLKPNSMRVGQKIFIPAPAQ